MSRISTTLANAVPVLVGATLLVAEFFDTLADEVNLIWPAKWSFVKVLYFANRVSPFLMTPLPGIYKVLITHPEHQICRILFGLTILGVSTNIIISEGLMYVRLYALSGHKRWALVFLSSNLFLSGLAVTVALSYFLALGTWGPDTGSGCRTVLAPNLLMAAAYAVLLYSGLVAMLLSVYFGVKSYWESRGSRLFQVLYRDGTFYFIVLAAMSVGNGIAALFLPTGYQYMMGPLQAILHSTLSTRMVLRLRAQAKHGLGYNEVACGNNIDPIQFRKNTISLGSTNHTRSV